MEGELSIGTRAVASLLVVTILGSGLAGVAAGASSAEPALTGTAAASISDSLETDGTTGTLEDATDETTDTVAETTDNTTGAVENTTDGTTDTVEGTTDRTTDELENATSDGDDSDSAIDATVNETTEAVDDTVSDGTDAVDGTVNETGDPVDDTVSNGTDAVDGTVNETGDAIDDTVSNGTETVDETEDLVDTTLNETGLNASLEAEAGVDGQSSSSDSDDDGGARENESAADNASTGSGNGDGSDASEMPSPTETATDAVLVGMLGAITASGAAAGSAAAGGAGASGAAGSAGAASAGWLSEFRNVGSLRRAGTDLWKVLPLFRYSQYDDSDPLEHDRRRAIYETIEADPGCYLSRVSDRADIPLSTVRYHVRILEDEDMVTAIKRNGKRRYFLEETDAELRAALAEPAKRDVLEALSDLGAAHNGRLAEELERDPSTVSHHLAALEEDGLVVREKDGRSIVNQLPARVEAALRDEPTPEADLQPAPADD
ncbi:helix-turn-helix domain-containing protein [Natrinema sp. LN54]|uniref:helix-turn-helix domain-containing protein n=1 Tax=Natrinema sp. LN54 TaxID=3458705 RepID=UPI004035BC72